MCVPAGASGEEEQASEAQLRRQRLADLFYAMDADLNGMLDVGEFREAMRQVRSWVSVFLGVGFLSRVYGRSFKVSHARHAVAMREGDRVLRCPVGCVPRPL